MTTLLARLLAEPWFALPPPKSTGRDQFHLDWLQARLGAAAIAPADVQATLLELTARTIADALRAQQPTCARVLVCGGGVHNPVLLRELRARAAGRGGRIHRRARAWIRISSKRWPSPGWRARPWPARPATCPRSPARAVRACSARCIRARVPRRLTQAGCVFLPPRRRACSSARRRAGR